MFELIFQHKGLSLEKLNLACRIAHAGGIRSAVGEDSSTQSLASRQMKELSQYFGTSLFKRSGRSIELTESGRQLVKITESFLSELEHFLRSVRNLPDVFRLGVGDAIFQWYLLPKLHELTSKCPNINLIPSSLPTKEIMRKIDRRELDAGLIHLGSSITDDISHDLIGEVSYRLFIPRSLVKNQQRTNQPSLKNLPICTLTGNGTYAQAVSTLLSSFDTKPQLLCSSTTQIYSAVQSGHFAAILPERARNGFSKDILSFSMTELASFTRRIYLVYRQPTNCDSEAKKNVISFLKTILQ